MSERRRSEDAALTVGSFDGVHVGHQAILRALLRRARSASLPAGVVTFEPHPMHVLRPGQGPALLTDRLEKAALLAAAGVDRVHVLAFTAAFARIGPRAFVRDLLVGELGCRELVVGEDHRFGHARAGGLPELEALARELDLGLEVVPRVLVEGAPASSTRTRRAVSGGELDLARRLLGRSYGVLSQVVHGAGRGTGLGVPTANLRVHPRKEMPPEGIYACRAEVRGRVFAAAAHWGPRPAFGEPGPVLEAHLLDGGGDLYGEWMDLQFLERIREVRAFGSAGDLSRAMSDDLRRAREIVATTAALQPGGSR